jgi:class III poly(R)-hydroxyalkanoic acid synthase PhaE subunit
LFLRRNTTVLGFPHDAETAMSNTKSPQDWMKDWQALQKQYWTAWTDATRGMKPEMPDPATPWHEGFEQWARLFGDSGKQNETLERLMASAKGYSSLMQSMIGAAAGKPAGEGAARTWTDALRQGFNMPGAEAFLQNNPFAQLMHNMHGPGVQGFDQLSQSFAPFLAQARQEGMSWLSVPAFGYLREHQEHYQKMAAAFVEFQEAVGKYNELMFKAGQRSFELFQDKLAAREEPGRQIESPRALYDLWVDAAEDAYQQIALSEEFRKVYGDVVNAQMRVRSQIQQEVERIGVDLGMPTRTELNSVHKRMHDLRRELRAGGRADAGAQIEALRAEVRQLREQLRAREAKPVSVPAAPAKPKPRVAPARKRAAAVAKPRSVSKQSTSKQSGSSFNEALQAMKKNSGSRK